MAGGNNGEQSDHTVKKDESVEHSNRYSESRRTTKHEESTDNSISSKEDEELVDLEAATGVPISTEVDVDAIAAAAAEKKSGDSGELVVHVAFEQALASEKSDGTKHRLEKEGEQGAMMEESSETSVTDTSSSNGDDNGNDAPYDVEGVPYHRVAMPLLRRNTATVHSNLIPGAQYVGGIGSTNDGGSTEDREQDTLEGTLGLQLDSHVIGGAVLVRPEDEAPQDSEHPTDPTEHTEQEVIEGQIVPSSNTDDQTQQDKPSCWFSVLVLVTLVATGVFLVVFFTGRESDSAHTNKTAATSAPIKQSSAPEDELTLYPPFRDDLAAASIKAIEELGSSIYFANKWMIQDPYLSTYSLSRQLQRFTLVALYYGSNGDNWFRNDGWLDYSVSECDWYHNTIIEELKGKPVCDEDSNLLLFTIAENNLQGTIPDMSAFNAMPHVPYVYALDLANNNLTGTTASLHTGVPIEIISLSNNQFDTIATSMGATGAGIRVLNVDNNRLRLVDQGLLWILFPSLERLNCTGNEFEGVIHPNMKHCKNLTYMGLGHNIYGGSLPSELGLLTKLEALDFSDNINLSGTLPTEIGLLTNLRQLDIRGTSITGPLPPQSFCLPSGNAEGRAVELLANCSMVQCDCN